MDPRNFLTSMKLKEDCLHIQALEVPFFPQNTQLQILGQILGQDQLNFYFLGYFQSLGQIRANQVLSQFSYHQT